MKTTLAHRAPLRQTRRRGFTLTEIAIVLGIVGLILGAIWVAAAAVYNNLRISHANTEILQIAQGVRSLYAGSSNDTGLTTDNLVCAKVVPSDMVNGACGAGTLLDPWPQGATTVLVPVAGDSFTIEMTQVPPASCINLLMAVAGPSRDPGLFYAGSAVAAGTAEPSAPAFAPNFVATPPLAQAAIANKFGGCGTAAAVTLHFAFSLK